CVYNRARGGAREKDPRRSGRPPRGRGRAQHRRRRRVLPRTLDRALVPRCRRHLRRGRRRGPRRRRRARDRGRRAASVPLGGRRSYGPPARVPRRAHRTAPRRRAPSPRARPHPRRRRADGPGRGGRTRHRSRGRCERFGRRPGGRGPPGHQPDPGRPGAGAAHRAPGGPAARRSAPGAGPAGRPAPAARRRVPGHRRPVRPRGRGAAPARRRHRAPGPRRHLRPARARRQWTAHRLRLLAEVSAAHRGSSSIRWWSSARLRITVGITVLSAVVFATMVVFVLHLLALSSDRSADTRLNREAADFSTFMNAGVLPSFAAESPTAEDLIRAYLSQQYPADQLPRLRSADDAGTQFTLSRYAAEDDPLFPPTARSRIQRTGLSPGEGSGVIDDDVRWRKATVDSPAGPATLVVAINDAEARDETADIARLLIYTSVGGLLLAALMAWIIAGQMLVPVRRIREAADTVTAEDLARRVPAACPDEIVALADTVNAMLERVEDAYRTQREFLDDA